MLSIIYFIDCPGRANKNFKKKDNYTLDFLKTRHFDHALIIVSCELSYI